MTIWHFWPQLLVLAVVFTRVLTGFLVAMGSIEIKPRKSGPFARYVNGLIVLAITQYVLWAGGFYSALLSFGG